MPAESVTKSIELLYAAFRHYRLVSHVEGCPCCVTEGDQRKIREVTLRELQGDQLERFAGKVATTWGGERELKHFLPRLLELVATKPDFVDPQIVFGKLAYCRWRDWPKEEQVAVRCYFSAIWKRMLRIEGASGSVIDITSLLTAISEVEADLHDYLEAWMKDTSETAVRRLAEFLNDNAYRIVKKGCNASDTWGEGRKPMEQVVEWIRQPAIGTKLEEAFFRSSTEAYATELSTAIEWRERLVINGA